MGGCEVSFPNLGIYFENVGSYISIFGFHIAFYGMIITLGMISGYLIACWQAKRTGQDPEVYLDLALYAIIFAVIGARLYYVIFAWDEFASNPLSVFNIRTGGLAIYGGVIGGLLTCFVYARVKKLSFFQLTDTAVAGLVLGQVIGRWGNFFNKEAFGSYTNNLFAMKLPWDEAKLHVSYDAMTELSKHVVDGYITVHPTFLYESVWNLVLLILILCYTKHKKFEGELLFLYLAGYGLGRLWIEGLRTDQLRIWGTGLAASQVLSILLVISALAVIIAKRVVIKKRATQ